LLLRVVQELLNRLYQVKLKQRLLQQKQVQRQLFVHSFLMKSELRLPKALLEQP
jgi:hypothetical protein